MSRATNRSFIPTVYIVVCNTFCGQHGNASRINPWDTIRNQKTQKFNKAKEIRELVKCWTQQLTRQRKQSTETILLIVIRRLLFSRYPSPFLQGMLVPSLFSLNNKSRKNNAPLNTRHTVRSKQFRFLCTRISEHPMYGTRFEPVF